MSFWERLSPSRHPSVSKLLRWGSNLGLVALNKLLLRTIFLLAAVGFAAITTATAIFSHGNVSLSRPIDPLLRCFIVTPDMHRIHHSVVIQETNSNYGFNLPWWDYLFDT